MTQNLLSNQEKLNLKNGYKLKFANLFSWMLFAASMVSIVIFLPVYFLANLKTAEAKTQMREAALKEQENILALPKEINAKARLAISFMISPQVSGKIEALRGESPGIVLTGINFSEKNKILLSGISKTRNNLIDFNKKLSVMEFVKNTTVPVGSFTKDADLPFNITITLK